MTLTQLIRRLPLTVGLMAAASASQAAPLLTYGTVWDATTSTYTCTMLNPCTTSSGVTGSQLQGNTPQSTGYYPMGNVWSLPYIAGHNASINPAVYSFTASFSATTLVSTFDFSFFSNDCQNNTVPAAGCAFATWSLEQSINGGPSTVLLGSFSPNTSLTSYIPQNFSVVLDQTFNASDTVTFTVRQTSNGVQNVTTGQYMFDNLSLNTEVPAPGTLALAGLALAGLRLARRRQQG